MCRWDKWILLLVLLAFPVVGSAQIMYADEFMAHVQEKQARIDLIRSGIQNVSLYLDLDNAEANALETSDPQDYIDFTAARFCRMLSIMNYAAADVAGDVAEFITLHRDDGVISPIVIEEGIAKYSEMRDFLLQYANQTHADFIENWEKHYIRYGDLGTELLIEDNDFMRLYGGDIEE